MQVAIAPINKNVSEEIGEIFSLTSNDMLEDL